MAGSDKSKGTLNAVRRVVPVDEREKRDSDTTSCKHLYYLIELSRHDVMSVMVMLVAGAPTSMT